MRVLRYPITLELLDYTQGMTLHDGL